MFYGFYRLLYVSIMTSSYSSSIFQLQCKMLTFSLFFVLPGIIQNFTQLESTENARCPLDCMADHLLLRN